MPFVNGEQLSYYDAQLVMYARNNKLGVPMLYRLYMVRTEFERERGWDKRVPIYQPNWDRIWRWLRDDLRCPSRNLTVGEVGAQNLQERSSKQDAARARQVAAKQERTRQFMADNPQYAPPLDEAQP